MEVRFRFSAAIALALLAACEYPQDADGTFDKIEAGGALRVGIAENPPWALFRNSGPTGVEPRLVQAFADSLDAKIVWAGGTESGLIAALKEHQLDLVIGGYDASSHWASEVAASQPYAEITVVVAAPKASPASVGSIEDGAILYPADRPEFAAYLAENGFKPEAATEIRNAAAALYEFEAPALGLVPTETELAKKRLVMLVAPGESRFLYELYQFLASRERSDILGPERTP